MEKTTIKMLYADEKGNILEHPHLRMAGASGEDFCLPGSEDLVPLPEGSRLFFLPGTRAVGWDARARTFRDNRSGRRGTRSFGTAVAALLAPGYTSNLLPAYRSVPGRAMLPLWSYTAVGWDGDTFVTAATAVDENPLWRPSSFDDTTLPALVREKRAHRPENRLLRHLARCATRYHCFAAKNVFFKRGEIPLPTAPSCNARCLGCISLQPSGCCPAPQERIPFVPTAEEIVQVVCDHFDGIDDSIASFGQGCEGEPLTQAPVIGRAVASIRRRTAAGTLNVNTNGYSPERVALLADSGMDSIRFSINSLDRRRYDAYFRPKGYTFDDVLRSIDVAGKKGLFVALNLLFFPGVNDRTEEADRLLAFLDRVRVDLIQLRNLNIDPQLYLASVPPAGGERLGVPGLLEAIRKRSPDTAFGYFNRPRRSRDGTAT